MCETGGGRRAWLQGQTNVSKVHTLKCAAYNLGLLLRKVWGYCKPRNMQAGAAALFLAMLVLLAGAALMVGRKMDLRIGWWLGGSGLLLVTITAPACTRCILGFRKNRHSLTGC